MNVFRAVWHDIMGAYMAWWNAAISEAVRAGRTMSHLPPGILHAGASVLLFTLVFAALMVLLPAIRKRP